MQRKFLISTLRQMPLYARRTLSLQTLYLSCMRTVKVFSDVFVLIILAIVASGMLMGIMSAISYMGSANMITLDTSSVWWRIARLINACALGNLQILLDFSAATVLAVTHILAPRLVLSSSA